MALPLGSVARSVDAFLQQGGRRGAGWSLHPAAWIGIVFFCAGCYGATMAAYFGFGDDRMWMVLFGVVKVPMLFVATLALAVPFFYVLNILVGVGDDFATVRGALVDYQLAVAIQLAALAPVTVVVNYSESRYESAQAWSTLMFAIAAWNARRSLTQTYAELEVTRPTHRWLRHTWFALYAFVGVQMAWTLRPFIGNPELPAQFFRDTIGNAYVNVGRVLMRFF